MASIPKISVGPTWVEVYAETGISSKSAISITTDQQPVYVLIQDTDPNGASYDAGHCVNPGETNIIGDDHDFIWIAAPRDGAQVSVQLRDDTPTLSHQFPAASFEGKRALSVQNYIESNVKLGYQWVASHRATIVSGASLLLGITTGDTPVIIKARYITQAGSTEVTYKAEMDVAFTGGTVFTPKNPNNVNRGELKSTWKYGVTRGANGPEYYQYLDPYSILGSSNPATGRIGSDTQGLEYILQPNVSHVFTIANPGTGDAAVFWWLTFAEVEPDLPL